MYAQWEIAWWFIDTRQHSLQYLLPRSLQGVFQTERIETESRGIDQSTMSQSKLFLPVNPTPAATSWRSSQFLPRFDLESILATKEVAVVAAMSVVVMCSICQQFHSEKSIIQLLPSLVTWPITWIFPALSFIPFSTMIPSHSSRNRATTIITLSTIISTTPHSYLPFAWQVEDSPC